MGMRTWWRKWKDAGMQVLNRCQVVDLGEVVEQKWYHWFPGVHGMWRIGEGCFW